MLIEQAILTRLLADSAISTLVGTRIYYVRADQAVAKPYIVFSKISAIRVSSHDGGSGLANPRFQFSCFGETYKSVTDIAVAIQDSLEGFTGVMGGVGGVNVNGCYYEDETDFYEEDSKLYHRALDFKLWHDE